MVWFCILLLYLLSHPEGISGNLKGQGVSGLSQEAFLSCIESLLNFHCNSLTVSDRFVIFSPNCYVSSEKKHILFVINFQSTGNIVTISFCINLQVLKVVFYFICVVVVICDIDLLTEF